MLCGPAPADPASIAALAHAVRAAGAELLLRLGAGQDGSVTLRGARAGISLYPAPGEALLLLEHPPGTAEPTLADWARELLSQLTPPPPPAKPRASGLVSLSDALNVTEP